MSSIADIHQTLVPSWSRAFECGKQFEHHKSFIDILLVSTSICLQIRLLMFEHRSCADRGAITYTRTDLELGFSIESGLALQTFEISTIPNLGEHIQ